jgi:hypothetical protein
VAKTIIANYSTSKSAEDILQQVFADFTKPTYAGVNRHAIMTHLGG